METSTVTSNSKLLAVFAKCVPIVFVLLMSELAAGQVITLYAEHYPPYTINAKKNQSSNVTELVSDNTKPLVGLDIELIQQAYSAVGVEVGFEYRPWKRIMRDVEQGHILGGVSCRKTDPRKLFAEFSEPVSHSRQAYILRKTFERQIPQSLNDLKSMNVVIVSGYSQQALLDAKEIKYRIVSSITQGLNLVRHRNQDVFFSGWEGSAYKAQQLGFLDELAFFQPSMVNMKKFRVCFSKKYAASAKWRLLLDEGLEKIQKAGQALKIKQKYGITH